MEVEVGSWTLTSSELEEKKKLQLWMKKKSIEQLKTELDKEQKELQKLNNPAVRRKGFLIRKMKLKVVSLKQEVERRESSRQS